MFIDYLTKSRIPVIKNVISTPTMIAITTIKPETSFSRFCISSAELFFSDIFFNEPEN